MIIRKVLDLNIYIYIYSVCVCVCGYVKSHLNGTSGKITNCVSYSLKLTSISVIYIKLDLT